ncbi:sugar phosphate nucleotidyltransferase, partial [Salmonella sp. SAL4438]|uniref:sugar phosphate nucleotidyltransferase n=1 Tax=Salmonella sp. SAL4438 TaxID=3159893 RepID=UPI00397C732C
MLGPFGGHGSSAADRWRPVPIVPMSPCIMASRHVLAIIQAGGAGSRMDVLTRERAKPALPFAGIHQLIDFPLSNLTHSGITNVWLSVQY